MPQPVSVNFTSADGTATAGSDYVIAYGTLVHATVQLLPVVADERSHVLGVPASVTYSCLLAGFVGLILTAAGNAIRLWHGSRLPHEVTIAAG